MKSYKKIRIAIIDDGINSTYLPTTLRVIERNLMDSSTLDSYNLTHGTMCAAIIYRYFKTDVIYSYKIMNYTNPASANKLIQALQYCLQDNIDVVNLSIGTINLFDIAKIHNIIKNISNKLLIIASLSNKNVFTIPACLPEVICVKSTFTSKSISINKKIDGDINILAPSTHTISFFDNYKYKTQICNSYSTAYVTAVICKNLHKFNYKSIQYYDNKPVQYFLNELYSKSFIEYIEDSEMKSVHSLPFLRNSNLNDDYFCIINYSHNIDYYQLKRVFIDLFDQKIIPVIISDYNNKQIDYGFKINSLHDLKHKTWSYYQVDIIIYLAEIDSSQCSNFFVKDNYGIRKIFNCFDLYNYFIKLFE